MLSKEKSNQILESFERQKFMNLLGAKVLKIDEGYCEIELDYNEQLTQQHGYFHAGVISTIADNAAGYAAFSMMELDSSILTVEFKLNLMAPANGSKLIAKSNVLKSGKTLTVWEAKVYIVAESGIEKLCAAAQSTLIQLKNQQDNASRNN